jgi:hypothetical protein
MGKLTQVGFVPPDDEMFSGLIELFPLKRLQPSVTALADDADDSDGSQAKSSSMPTQQALDALDGLQSDVAISPGPKDSDPQRCL